ncbi:MAG: type II toxin-antitoxin system VapC family toxin [Chitinophagales bacterium]|nr:type II toxin-antitoxin system VapC family toxin [Chitinophagales bacterium]
MNYLIDTHILLWIIFQKEKINKSILNILEDSKNRVIVSQISIFEIAIKNKIGKLPDFPLTIEKLILIINEIGLDILPIKNEHFVTYDSFLFNENHKDPFDRLILSTSFYENFILISNDSNFEFYNDRITIFS